MMKKNISLLLILICASAIAIFWSCNKKLDLVAPTTPAAGLAYIKIAHFSPSLRQIFNKSDSFNLYVNGTKINGSFVTFGSIFPSVTDLYAAVPAGGVSVRLTTNGIVNPDSLTIFTVNKSLNANSYYSLIITDSLLSLNPAEQIFVQDNFIIADTLHYTMRFVHAIVNDTAGTAVDIYSQRNATNIFKGITPATTTGFVSFNYTLVADTLIIRRAGTLFELARLSTVTSPLARQRAYTLVYKGQAGTTSGTKARSLVLFTNQ